jgi:hypothetical protein
MSCPVHSHPEMVMIYQANRLDGIGGHHRRVINGQHVVAVVLLASFGQVGGAGEKGRILVIKIDHYHFIVDHLPQPAAPFGPKGCRDMAGQTGGVGEDAIGLTRLVQVKALFGLGDAIGEDILAPAQIPELIQDGTAALQFHHSEEDRTVGLLDGLGHPVQGDGSGCVRGETGPARQLARLSNIERLLSDLRMFEPGHVGEGMIKGLFIEGSRGRIVKNKARAIRLDSSSLRLSAAHFPDQILLTYCSL